MPTQPSKIVTPLELKITLVDPDYIEFKKNTADLRNALHLAMSLFHLRDWTFHHYRKDLNWSYGGDIGKYQQYLEGRSSKFGYIRDLANSAKHDVLDPKKKPCTKMLGMANTEVQGSTFQLSAIGSTAFKTQSFIVTETGPAQFENFESAADDVMTMWNDLFGRNSWK